jgi:hypothetical protein
MKAELIETVVKQYYKIKKPEAEKSGPDKLRSRLQEDLARIKSQDDWQDDPDLVSLAEEIECSLQPKVNPTLPFEIEGRIEGTRQCPDCLRPCNINRTVNSRILESPVRHWRHSCTHCKMTRHPTTKKFEINNKSVAFFFADYLRNKK